MVVRKTQLFTMSPTMKQIRIPATGCCWRQTNWLAINITQIGLLGLERTADQIRLQIRLDQTGIFISHVSPGLKFSVSLKISAKNYFRLNCTGKVSVALLHMITIPKRGLVMWHCLIEDGRERCKHLSEDMIKKIAGMSKVRKRWLVVNMWMTSSNVTYVIFINKKSSHSYLL